MTDKIMECITNPVKCKLLLEIYSQERATAKHLSDVLSDIPQATLYRNLKKMLNDGLIKVVEKKQVRGTVESTYALALNLNSEFEAILAENSGPLYMQLFMQDMSGFSLSHLYLSDEELIELMKNISNIIKTVEKNEPKTERKLRTLGIIVTPPEN